MAPRRGQKRASAPKKGGRGGKKQKAAEEEPQAEEKSQQQQEEASSAEADQQPSTAQEDKTVAADDSKAGGEAEGAKAGGKEEKAAGSDGVVLEKGHFYCFYRPKVDAQSVSGPDDIQKFYVLLSPDGAVGRPAREEEVEGKRAEERQPHAGHEGKPPHRLIVISSKSLPGPHAPRPRPWAFVDAVSSDLHEVEHGLERYSYDTKTRGHREIQPARLAAEARYEIVRHGHEGDTRLLYELELPSEPTAVQRAFNIDKEGQFSVLVKNPTFNSAARSDRWAGFREGEKAQFPPELHVQFAGKRQPEVRYIPLSTPDFLNYRHCELVLMPAKRDVKEEWGKLAEQLEQDVEDEGEKTEQQAYKELEMNPKEFPDAVEAFK